MSRWASIEKIKYSIWRSLDIISVKCVNSVFYLHIICFCSTCNIFQRSWWGSRSLTQGLTVLKQKRENQGKIPDKKEAWNQNNVTEETLRFCEFKTMNYSQNCKLNQKVSNLLSLKRFPLNKCLMIDLVFGRKWKKTKPGKEELAHLVFVGY